MSIPLLPRLNDDNKIAITKRGEWQSEQQNTLRNLVSDLKVTSDYKSDITSIPDLWARPAMFEMVLFDKKHNLHKKYVSEWRGILAIMALREIRNFQDIDIVRVELPEKSQIKDDAPKFLKAVVSMLPDGYKEYKDDTGSNIQIITYLGRPLAIVWPSILICPSANLNPGISRNISWWNITGIEDPINSLSDTEKNLLNGWLDKIIDNLGNTDKEAKLIGLLKEFKEDLGNVVNDNNFSLSSGIITGYCEILGKAIKNSITNNFLSNSNVLLINKRKTCAKKLLIMTNDLGKQWNKALNDIVVAGSINLNASLPAGGVLYRNDVLNDVDLKQFDAEVRMGDSFFTDKICLIGAKNDSFPGALKNIKILYQRECNVLLPVKKELLNYLTPEYIIKNFRISVINNKDIKVELDLPLSGFSADGKQLTISKIYEQKDNVEEFEKDIIELELPLIQIWPNFIPHDSRNWQAYYSYYDNLVGNTFEAEPLWDDAEDRKMVYNGGFEVKISKGKEFPEGYVCKTNFETNINVRTEEIGLILLKKPNPLPSSIVRECKIGIDFGTTNTVAYCSYGNPEIMKLKNRLFEVTDYDSVLKKAELRRHFFTVAEQPNGNNISIRTLFNANDAGEFTGNLNQPIFPGVIYYLDGMDNIKEDEDKINILQGKDMKWTEYKGKDNMKNFLLHLCLQCTAEAIVDGASSIKWYYSYPGAFSRTKKADLKRCWEKIIEVLKDTSPFIKDTPINQTESVSMALFFANDSFSKAPIRNRGIVCLDIGGGSTDIAIWQGNENEPKGKCSLKFAGNDILNKYLFIKKRSVLEKFFSNDTSFNKSLQELISESDERKFNLNLEALLKYHEEKIFSFLWSKSVDSDIKAFISVINFALAGIFYYSGVIVGNLRKDTDFKQLPHCYVGGNGSKLLNWVSKGKYDINDAFGEFYKWILGVGISSKDERVQWNSIEEIIIGQSAHPKEEVAYGLVSENSLRAVNKKEECYSGGSIIDNILGNKADYKVDSDSIQAVETYYIGNEKKENADISIDDIKKGVKVDEEIPAFKQFVNVFNALLSKYEIDDDYKIEFSKKDYNTIVDQTNELFAILSDEDPNSIILEPPFIVLLKKSLDVLANK